MSENIRETDWTKEGVPYDPRLEYDPWHDIDEDVDSSTHWDITEDEQKWLNEPVNWEGVVEQWGITVKDDEWVEDLEFEDIEPEYLCSVDEYKKIIAYDSMPNRQEQSKQEKYINTIKAKKELEIKTLKALMQSSLLPSPLSDEELRNVIDLYWPDESKIRAVVRDREYFEFKMKLQKEVVSSNPTTETDSE